MAEFSDSPFLALFKRFFLILSFFFALFPVLLFLAALQLLGCNTAVDRSIAEHGSDKGGGLGHLEFGESDSD